VRIVPERLWRYAAEESDTDEVKLRKLIGTILIAFAVGTYLLYGLTYIAYSEWFAARTALAGSVFCALVLLAYIWVRRYTLLWFLFAFWTAASMVMLHVQLGGFSSSAFVVIWLLLVPVVTIVADSPRRGLGWGVAAAVAIIALALLEDRLPGHNNLPSATATTLTAMNLIGFAAYMLLTVFFYIWRIDAISRLVVQEREARIRAVENASRHKSEFLANMSHELRTPLNAVIGFSEVLDEKLFGTLNEKQVEYVRDIHASGQHLLALVNDVLDLSKVEAGRMEIEAEEFDLPGAVSAVLTLVRERVHRHGIALDLQASPESFAVRADLRKVKQIVLNLLSNAVKFTPDGGRIHVVVAREGNRVEVSIADTGPGIAEDEQAAVFEEFRQVGNDRARKAEGTGLGLPLAKKFVELHGGQIWVKSELGTGSTFGFTLPFR